MVSLISLMVLCQNKQLMAMTQKEKQRGSGGARLQGTKLDSFLDPGEANISKSPHVQRWALLPKGVLPIQINMK